MKDLAKIVHAMSGLRIAVIGDAIQDIYHWGDVTRVCPEAPAPVFVQAAYEERPGGAANVAANLAALGVEVVTAFAPAHEHSRKHRYMVGHHLVMRIDDDRRCSYPEQIDVLAAINGWQSMGFPGANAVIVSDYAKGLVTRGLMSAVVEECKERDTLLVVDPKQADWSLYSGATWICPNEKEHREEINGGSIDRLIKLGANGCRIEQHFKDGKGLISDIPAYTRNVYDVTGAGDTVVAVFTAALATGAEPGQAATLAMLAAGWVVGQIGTASCALETLLSMASLHDEQSYVKRSQGLLE